jgi:hypothetical protein
MNSNVEQGGIAEDAAAERARETIERYGEHAADYVETRIEASRTSGENGDAAMWERVSELVAEEKGQN